MGKKTKLGKSRKDKFYHLAKETGYRSRSAFKLLQLNRRFEFLQRSRVCIDLCAAPGGWLQVAQKFMPVSSVIVGVDLVPIKPIYNVTSLQEDITTDKCKQALKKELQTWSADVILHDGAPNVGQNWLHDAFQQAQLTLHALKLALGFLKKGGWFVTKVFRSKDYNALLWVFQQLFKKVHSTKPQASRNESAEIFVVCEFYKAPDKLDPKFVDPKHVFKEVNTEVGPQLNLVHPTKRKKQAEGYADNDYTLHHVLPVSQFISSDKHMELLAGANQIVFDREDVLEHPLTTAEIEACCEDIQVLGKKEIKSLVTWRKKLCKEFGEKEEPEKEEKKTEDDDSAAEEKKIDEQLEELHAEEQRKLKKKRRQVMKEKRVLRDRMARNLVAPGDQMETNDDIALFDFARIKKKKHLSEVSSAPMPQSESDEDDDDAVHNTQRKNVMYYEPRRDDHLMDEDDEMEDAEQRQEELEFESDDEPAGQVEEQSEDNPLLIDSKEHRNRNMWFTKEVFEGIGDEMDGDVKQAVKAYETQGGTVSGLEEKQPESDDDDDDESDDSDSTDDEDEERQADSVPSKASSSGKARSGSKKDGFEIVPQSQPDRKLIKLDSVELAIGEEMVKSRKRRREIEEMSYNRYTYMDEGLPDWFSKEEARHTKIPLPVTKEQIDYYKEKRKAIDAQPIKKVAEAKARKKRKMNRKVEKARKKAEAVSDTVDVSDREKWKQIQDIYKRAGLLSKQKKEVSYVVAKKGIGRRVRRPTGVKGRFRVVDPRMKKDNMKAKQKQKSQKTKGKGKRK